MDETWLHYFTLESKWWTVAGESYPKQLKMQTSAGKVLVSIFCDAEGILFIDYHEKGRTISSEYYIALLVHLKEEIAIMATNEEEKVLFYQDNALSQVDCNDSKTTWIALWIASAPTLFFRSSSLRLLAVCRSQKNAPGKEIWLQWRNDYGHLGK